VQLSWSKVLPVQLAVVMAVTSSTVLQMPTVLISGQEQAVAGGGHSSVGWKMSPARPLMMEACSLSRSGFGTRELAVVVHCQCQLIPLNTYER
jgi:hypothetical protein